MNKTRRLLKERIRRCDLVVEVLDARLPSSSQNPMLGEIRGEVPCLRVLTKPDLADPTVTSAWLLSLERTKMSAIELQATDQRSVKRLVQACKKLVPRRGSHGLPVRVMIAGIPNVGKSTIFNLLAGKKKAAVRNQPAVTRMEQSILTDHGLALVDTPGVLWPKLEDQVGAYRLATSGAIGIGALDPVEVARFAVNHLLNSYPDSLASRYPIQTANQTAEQVLEAVAQCRGLLKRGGVVDYTKASELILRELRSGKLGRISFERPRVSKKKAWAAAKDSSPKPSAEPNAVSATPSLRQRVPTDNDLTPFDADREDELTHRAPVEPHPEELLAD